MSVRNSLLAVLCLIFVSAAARAEILPVYGHISLTQPGVQVLRAGSSEPEEAIVNLPLLAGDAVITPAGSRCEIQSDNGTVLRLDHDSELRVATVLAQSLTSNWKVTSLQLVRGAFYIINNTYNQEMVQAQTPNAALKLDRDCRALLALTGAGDTSLYMLNGRATLLFGRSSRSLGQERVKGGQSLRVSAADQLQPIARGFSDFHLWNEGVDRHFDELHEGVNQLPKPLQRYMPALVHWAAKWSSVYGEWVWDDLYGYVWRPYTDTFSLHRPFFNASWVTIRGHRFLVPQEPWGWAPAYLGTWVWMGRHGWVWVPGDFGRSEPWYMRAEFGFHGFYTMGDWFGWLRPAFYTDVHDLRRLNYPIPHAKPKMEAPPEISRVFKAISSLPKAERREVVTDMAAQPGRLHRSPAPADEARTVPAAVPLERPLSRHDWNPDAAWAQRVGAEVTYRPQTNEFACPKMGLEGSRLTRFDRQHLREVGHRGNGDDARGRPASPVISSSSGAGDTSATVGKSDESRDAQVTHNGGGRR